MSIAEMAIWKVLWYEPNRFLRITHEKYCRSKFFNGKLNIKDALLCEQSGE